MDNSLKRISIFVPTRNHPKLMEYFLDSVASSLEKYGVDLYIYDTSDNELTKNVVDSYLNKNIKYTLDLDYSDKTTDLKILNGFSYLSSRYSYVWLCGDGYVPNLNYVMPQIAKYLDLNYHLIHFIDDEYSKTQESIELNAIELFKNYGWHLTLYGASIISLELIQELNLQILYEQFKNSGFYYWYLIFFALSQKNEKTVTVPQTETFTGNPYKKTNSSYSANGFARFWWKSWPNAVYALPSKYDIYKDTVCKMLGVNIGAYTLRGLIKLRLSNNLSYAILNENKDNIPKVTDVPLSRFYLIASIPIPILRFFRFCFKALNSTFRRLK